MRLADLDALERKTGGFRVSFERREGGMLASDHIPARDEPAIEDEAAAWVLAERVAQAGRGSFVNIYVVHATGWKPVADYRSRMLRAHPPQQPAGAPA